MEATMNGPPDPATATVFGRPQPTCPTHGRMHFEPGNCSDYCTWRSCRAAAHWSCHGYDGEGCDHVVYMHELVDEIAASLRMTCHDRP
jgi:hypothetical protein